MKTRKSFLLLGVLFSLLASAQNKFAPSLRDVTIFSGGAQVNRQITVPVKPGEQVISFVGFSPYTDVGSLQVKATGKITVLGVSHRYVYPDSAILSDKVQRAKHTLKAATRGLEELKSKRKTLQGQLEMVKTNCSVSNRTVATPLENIRQLNNYYYEEMMAINKKLLLLDDEEEKARAYFIRCNGVVDSLKTIKMKRLMTVDVKVDARQASHANFTFAYYTEGASWFPSYEIRANNTSEPLQLSYKANISQQTNEVWEKTKVTLSSANPNRSSIVPELKTYWLDYGLAPPTYDFGIDNHKVSGIIMDEDGEPIVGATVRVKGTSIATVTDLDGKYSITLPNHNRTLHISYIGMEDVENTVTGSYANFTLKVSARALQEVVVTGYGEPREAEMAYEEIKEVSKVKPVARRINDESSMNVSATPAKFGYEFEIHHPLTIPSDGKPTVSTIGNFEMPATYSYKSVPKINKSAFLVADAVGWENLRLLEGEASVFYENSFVGKTIVSPTMSTDTLHLSLGRDSGIKIDRKQVKNNSSRKVLSSVMEQDVEWEITVHNTRDENVSIRIYDQVPVSRNSEIKVNVLELSKGVYDKDNGTVYWDLSLRPGENVKQRLVYQVRYPKSGRLTIE